MDTEKKGAFSAKNFIDVMIFKKSFTNKLTFIKMKLPKTKIN